jgi:hypothetical protein
MEYFYCGSTVRGTVHAGLRAAADCADCGADHKRVGQRRAGVALLYIPKNLKVLPANADLRTIMRGYAGALGVECEYCHAAADPVTHREDRSSDANPEKDKARDMIRMTDDLNTKYLAQLSWRTDTDVISCGTCHRGQKHPPAFVPPPRQSGNGPGAPGAGAPPLPPPA